MLLLDLTLPTAEENLALDEALLEEAEETGAYSAGLLRFYRNPAPCVVLGYGNRVASEVRVPACAESGIPILRRASGGGTVLLGPGCLAYALILPTSLAPDLDTITGTNHWIMDRMRAACATATGRSVEIQGHTDLTIDGRKFSGNAQRRRRRTLLFHGTFLFQFDLAQIQRCLAMPSRQPDYRGDRGHGDFLMNLGLPEATVKSELAKAWDARAGGVGIPHERLEQLLAIRYRLPAWHLRF